MFIRVVLALALSAPPATAPAQADPSPCPAPVPARTVCGFLEVPERRDAPGRTIKVAYAVRHSPARDRKPDPVVFMGGGPGAPSMPHLDALARAFPDRDVVAAEQRGGAWSRPALACPETAQALLGRLREQPSDVGAAAARCRDRLAGQGVDLRGYRTDEIVADVVALRSHLGYERWNLLGAGYAARVMAAVAAADPAGTRAVVLGPGDDPRDPAAVMAGLGARDAFGAAVARLNARPARVIAVDPLLGREFTARVRGDDLAALLGVALRDPGTAAVAPALVGALARGDDALLRPLVERLGDELAAREAGLYHAVRCQDDPPPAASRLFTAAADKAVCDAWNLPRGAGPAALPVAALKAPVYVLDGRHDPATVLQARAVASRAGLAADDCARRKVAAFVADPAAPPSGPCPEARPVELRVTAAPYQIAKTPWLAAPFALFAAACLIQLVTAALKGLALPAFGGLSGLAFAGLTAQSVWELARSNAGALTVGLPAITEWYTALAVVSVLLTLAALVHNRRWPQITAAAIGAGFLVWWFTWVL
ncbi:alpha/beta fold hydrolase [Nonomuraea sp. NPDC049309]|uniref:alpha/beta fold hydrolase n=1 Tax=Nonomuraea sp. NPDC049309 TaxID=3364350 RepID=UPI00371BFD01